MTPSPRTSEQDGAVSAVSLTSSVPILPIKQAIIKGVAFVIREDLYCDRSEL